MAGKKQLFHRMRELEKQVIILRADIKKYYEKKEECYICHGEDLSKTSLACPNCGNNKQVKPIILDDNPVSLACYAQEYPENWKAMPEDAKSTKNGMQDKKPHADVTIERAGNLTKHGIEAIRAVAGTDEEYKAYVDKYSTLCVNCGKPKEEHYGLKNKLYCENLNWYNEKSKQFSLSTKNAPDVQSEGKDSQSGELIKSKPISDRAERGAKAVTEISPQSIHQTLSVPDYYEGNDGFLHNTKEELNSQDVKPSTERQAKVKGENMQGTSQDRLVNDTPAPDIHSQNKELLDEDYKPKSFKEWHNKTYAKTNESVGGKG